MVRNSALTSPRPRPTQAPSARVVAPRPALQVENMVKVRIPVAYSPRARSRSAETKKP